MNLDLFGSWLALNPFHVMRDYCSEISFSFRHYWS